MDGMIDVFVNVPSLDHKALLIPLLEPETRISDPGFSEKICTVQCMHMHMQVLPADACGQRGANQVSLMALKI